MESKSVRKIDILSILKYVLTKWLIVMLTAVIFAGAFGAARLYKYKEYKMNMEFAQHNKVTPVYGAFTIYITNFDNNESFYNRIEDVSAIIKSYGVLSQVIKECNLIVTYEQLYSSIGLVSSGVNQIEVSMDGSFFGFGSKQSLDIAESIKNNTLAIFAEKFGEGSIILMEDVHEKAYVLTRSIEVDEIKEISKLSVIKYAILGGAVGVIVGCVLVIFFMLLSTTLRSKSEVVEEFGIDLLGEIDTKNIDANEFKRIKKRIEDYKKLAIVSLTDKECRTIALDNIANALAVNGNTVVKLVVDVNDTQGVFDQYVNQEIKMDKLAVATDNAKVKVITLGLSKDNSIDTFSHPAFKQLVDELQESFNYVLVDCPAAKANAAYIDIAENMDTMVCVASFGVIKESDVLKFKYDASKNGLTSVGLIYMC